MDEGQLVESQMAYYRARAGEYDQWFFRQGRYDLGPEQRSRWFQEIAIVRTALREEARDADVLELACGTGLWTCHLAEHNRRVVAVDASPEVLAINRERVRSPNVEYVEADIFSWRPTNLFDVVFFSFWLSHVPPERFDAFWDSVKMVLKPGGRAFFVDSLFEQSSIPQDHGLPDRSGVVRRRLNDGREFDIVKVFYDPANLEHRLVERGWSGSVRTTGTFFFYGLMTPQNGHG